MWGASWGDPLGLPPPPPLPSFAPGSSLYEQHADTISTWINNGVFTNNCYMKSRGGASAETFRSLCDSLTATVTLMKMTNGKCVPRAV